MLIVVRKLEEAEGSVSGESAAAEGDAENDSGEDIAEEVHAEDDAGKRDAEREKDERDFERGVEIGEDERDGRCGHGVTRGERKFVGRENFGPAVRLDLARAWTLAETLERFEDNDADDGGESGRADGGEALRAAKE